MKVFLHYEDHDTSELHKSLKITLPKSWKTGPVSKLLGQFVESYNSNETLGPVNPLNESDLHLALRQEGDQSDTSTNNSKLVALASDAITNEVIPDRADVYIVHGPSKTLQEIQDEINGEKERLRLEQLNTVQCTHFGCKKRFDKGGPYPDCTYHKSPPVFHETAKFWSCCPNKKAYDWTEFEQIPGCCTGKCTDVKEDEQKEFLGGSDLREQLSGDGAKLKSIDDFNMSHAAGGSGAAPVLDRLKSVMVELGIEEELYDQVVSGIEREIGGDTADAELLEAVAQEMGSKLKGIMKSIAADQLRIK